MFDLIITVGMSYFLREREKKEKPSITHRIVVT